MLTSLDQLDTSKTLTAEIAVSYQGLKGPPNHKIIVNGQVKWHDTSYAYLSSVLCEHEFDILSSLVIEIEIFDKDYENDPDAAVIIDSITIDGIGIMPDFLQYSRYFNDKNWTEPTTHLGFNGVWHFVIPEAFYRWYHKVNGQGWLLYP